MNAKRIVPAGLALAVSLTALSPATALNSAGEGRRTFLKLNCYGCHGMAAGGGMGPNIVGAETGDISEVVKGGGEQGMPSFHAYATATDITNLAAYLRSIGKPGEPTFTHWWETNPSQ